MNTDIITKDDYVPSNRERIRAYRNRLDQWLEQSEAIGIVIENPVQTGASGEMQELIVPVRANNISKFLRKGGAK